ncbi:unnamed protein product, partial [Phaeothamnion confervicola]
TAAAEGSAEAGTAFQMTRRRSGGKWRFSLRRRCYCCWTGGRYWRAGHRAAWMAGGWTTCRGWMDGQWTAAGSRHRGEAWPMDGCGVPAASGRQVAVDEEMRSFIVPIWIEEVRKFANA